MKTIAELRATYMRTIEADRSLKPATKHSANEAMKAAFRVWPEVETRDIASITALDCLDWFSKFKGAASRYNNILWRVRGFFTFAIQCGLRPDNPMSVVKPAPIAITPPTLPSHEQFKKIIAYLENSPESRRAVRLVKFLVYSGRRIGEVLKMTREDITPQGIRARDTKNGRDIFGPILPEMAELIKTLPAEGPLFRIKNPRKALANACRSAGTAPLTNHQLRHLFATRCIECGVDIKTVSEWLGHSDGGALALKRYSHVRNEHSLEMAAKVAFIKAPEPEPSPAPVEPALPEIPAIAKVEPEHRVDVVIKISGQSTGTANSMKTAAPAVQRPIAVEVKPVFKNLHQIRREFEVKREAERELATLIRVRSVDH